MRSICCGGEDVAVLDPGQHDVLGAELEEDAVHLLVVVDVLLALLALDLVKRRLGDVDEARFEQPAHLPVEEGQQKRPDVRAVHVGVGHDDDLVVAGPLEVEGESSSVLADAGADRRDQGADLLVVQDLVDLRLLAVDQLSPQGEDGLVAAVPALLGRASGGIALDDVELGQGRIALGAVGELARQPSARRGPPCGSSPAPCGRPRGRGADSRVLSMMRLAMAVWASR